MGSRETVVMLSNKNSIVLISDIFTLMLDCEILFSSMLFKNFCTCGTSSIVYSVCKYTCTWIRYPEEDHISRRTSGPALANGTPLVCEIQEPVEGVVNILNNLKEKTSFIYHIRVHKCFLSGSTPHKRYLPHNINNAVVLQTRQNRSRISAPYCRSIIYDCETCSSCFWSILSLEAVRLRPAAGIEDPFLVGSR